MALERWDPFRELRRMEYTVDRLWRGFAPRRYATTPEAEAWGIPLDVVRDGDNIVVRGPCDPCDMDCSGDVDAFDIEPFLDLLFGEADPCCGERGDPGSTGDTDGDGDIDAFDIEPFLECLFP